MGSIPGQGTRISQAVQRGQKEKKLYIYKKKNIFDEAAVEIINFIKD